MKQKKPPLSTLWDDMSRFQLQGDQAGQKPEDASADQAFQKQADGLLRQIDAKKPPGGLQPK